jgi:signal peptidase I
VELVIGIAIAWLLVETWCVEGLVIPVWVPSGSMAETLLGTHRDVTCGDCGHRFACGTDLKPLSRRAVCPNCGYTGNDLSQQPEVDGDRLLIDKAAFLLRRPRRWEVVAFRHPFHATMICVKRVVGLPGETVEIRDGDFYVDGRIQRKTLAQQRAMSVLVYDADHPPTHTPGLLQGWQNDHSGGRWTIDAGRFLHAAQTPGGSVDWCVFHHCQRDGGGDASAAREVPVCDDYGYNQGGSASSATVADLRLTFRLVRSGGAGRILVRAADGDKRILVRFDPGAQRYEVVAADGPQPACSGTIPTIGGQRPRQIDVSLVDRQFLLAVDDCTLAAFPMDRPGHLPQVTASPLAIGADGPGVEIDNVRVYRDIYYTGATGGGAHWALDRPVRLAPDEYFMLGDNSPLSDDSRSWPQGPAVPANLLFGKPFLVHFPARQVNLWGWSFQLPDFARIRYIR